MANLDNIEDIKKIDKSDQLKLLVEFPVQCREAAKIGRAAKVSFDGKFKSIVFAGVGGSAMGGELIACWLAEKLNIPIFVNRNYTLPKFVDKDTLVFISSYSGNTEETLSAYEEAKKKGAQILAISSGGTLKGLTEKDKIQWVCIPGGSPPRCALGLSFFVPLVLLQKLGLIENVVPQIEKTAAFLKQLIEDELGPSIPAEQNLAKQLAAKLFGRCPIIYASCDRTAAVATRWKGQFGENSKTLSWGHLLPEMNHNEIMGWEFPKDKLGDFVPIFLRDSQDYSRIRKRMDVTSSILKKQGIESIDVEAKGNSSLERIFYLVALGDWVSFYLAILNGVDPTPVDKITYLKKELAKEA